MTVAISCNLSDGVILGVDSATTVSEPSGVVKVYEKADKLFQLSKLPIGIATYGLGARLGRSVGSYLREFELLNPNSVLGGKNSVGDVVEELRMFFRTIYISTLAPAIAKEKGKAFEEIPREELPSLGFVVGGFSANSFLSEVWNIEIPFHGTKGSAMQRKNPGDFGTDWFALYEPIQRYFKDYSLKLLDEVIGYFVQKRGSGLTPQEETDIQNVLGKYEYQVPYFAMPIREGIEHVRFLVSMVVNHHRFAVGAPVVGGNVNIGLVTYKGEQFQILSGER